MKINIYASTIYADESNPDDLRYIADIIYYENNEHKIYKDLSPNKIILYHILKSKGFPDDVLNIRVHGYYANKTQINCTFREFLPMPNSTSDKE